jgi:hypothetical protein
LTIYDVANLLVPQPPGLPLGLSLVTIAAFFVAAFVLLAAYIARFGVAVRVEAGEPV